jgi:uncharacterized Zn finger protein
VLARIYLLKHEYDSASNVVDMKPSKYRGYGYEQVDLEVARATRTSHPHRAIPVYLKYVRNNIDFRNRESYRTAAGLLAEARACYETLGDLEKWKQEVEAIKTEFKQLLALKDEMRKAGS